MRPQDAWILQAKCANTKVDPRIFDGIQVTPTSQPDYTEARAFCQGCPVKLDCLTDAIVNRETDCVRGGLAPLEYQALAGSRRAVRLKAPGEAGYRRRHLAVA